MAQLSDDCFAFGGALLSLDEAARLIETQVPPIADLERVLIGDALGRVVAHDIVAPVSLPPFDNAAVDGYAVRHADVAQSKATRLRIVDRVMAGSAAARGLGEGEAARIFTGAPMPACADTVFMQEDCRIEGDALIAPPGLKPGANRRLTGEDIQAGAVALPAGRRVNAADVALAAALGLTAIDVRRRPRVAVFSTGNEIAEPGASLPAASIYDANRHLILALLRQLGAEAHDLGILADEPKALTRSLFNAARAHDLVLTSGGVSTGDADYVKAAVESIGKLVFWRLGIKPGRPVAMGVIEGAAFAGLPGNPVAAFVTFVMLVRPLILRLAGARHEALQPLPVRAAFRYTKKAGRREYVRVALQRADDGQFEAFKHKQDGAGVLTSLTQTDGLVELTEETLLVEPGMSVGFIPYACLTG